MYKNSWFVFIILLALFDIIWSSAVLFLGLFSQGAIGSYALIALFFFVTGFGLLFFGRWARNVIIKASVPLSIFALIVMFLVMTFGKVASYLRLPLDAQFIVAIIVLGISVGHQYFLERPEVKKQFEANRN